jgi:hypothetical protein
MRVVAEPDAPRNSSKTDLITGGIATQERDIDVVLVTGAGASRAFGVNGTFMPLMSDWADHLVGKLSQRISYLEATGLRKGMAGEKFEARLGKFLQDAEAFRRTSDLLGPSVRFQDFGAGTQVMQAGGVMEEWHRQAVHHFDQVTGLIRESLYELFADAAVDLDAAAAAYQGLFGALGLGPDSRLVYATTNYDTVGEHALRRAGALPDWGQPPSLERDGEARVVVEGLLAGLPRYVPVLHLHGRVGWYRRDGRVFAANVIKHQEGFGIPVVMLPDPQKVYDQDDIIIALWREFSTALARAKRVFVLGHSLNDQYMLRALIQNVQPLDRIAVSVLGDDQNPPQPHPSAGPVMAKINQNLGNAAIIPMRFGTGADEGSAGIRAWTEKLSGNSWI